MQGKLKKNRKSAQVCSGNKRALRDSSKQQLWLRAARAAVSWQQEHEAVEALNTSGSIFCNGSIFFCDPKPVRAFTMCNNNNSNSRTDFQLWSNSQRQKAEIKHLRWADPGWTTGAHKSCSVTSQLDMGEK